MGAKRHGPRRVHPNAPWPGRIRKIIAMLNNEEKKNHEAKITKQLSERAVLRKCQRADDKSERPRV